MSVVIFFACLDLGQKSSFMDGNWWFNKCSTTNIYEEMQV
jgi:hypothetical protein